MTTESIQAVLLANAVRSFPYRQPFFRRLYLIFFLLVSLLILLPAWSILYIPVQNRPRRQWTLKKCLRVRFSRRLCGLVARCEIDYLGRDLSKDPDPTTLRFSHPVTIPPPPSGLLRGHPKEALAQLHASRGQWIPRYIHRYESEKRRQGVWGRWNDWQESERIYGFEEVKGFWYTGEKTSPEEGPQVRRPGDPVLLHFHGGGYLCGTAAETDATSSIPKALVKHSPIHHILSIDYRLAPSSPWPLPLLDAISAYYWLVKKEEVDERDIIVAGDSAGGHLALALIRWLRDEGLSAGLKLPKGLVLMSPWADLGFTNAWGEEAIKHNRDSDTIDDTFGPFACALLLRAQPASIMHTSPYISPASLLITDDKSFIGLPPTYIVYGGAERLSINIQLLWNNIQKCRQSKGLLVPDRLFVSPDGVHDFMIFPWMAEEASEVYEDLDVWLRNLLAADLPEDEDQEVVGSSETEQSEGRESDWNKRAKRRRMSRQLTKESLRSQKSPTMGPVGDHMLKMVEDMSGEGLSMIGSPLTLSQLETNLSKGTEWLTPLTAELRPEYGFDDDEIPWYDLDGSSEDEAGIEKRKDR
ncbi:uncharacterized protein I206_106112 [Kwoniella pini CBS 10737]|uniref:Endoplasmic reticulum protein n=1 Tax=Kwoniella pini CBS 10737 TaxID=1296096 RepID=A0A1B9I143_9TREE|nr:endoplasmic reticulum protein [Kwoniella pini CBS 10737]OCF49247.1 endoplasmic reticulum protein [Kwoniella pini CBS 10737]